MFIITEKREIFLLFLYSIKIPLDVIFNIVSTNYEKSYFFKKITVNLHVIFFATQNKMM